MDKKEKQDSADASKALEQTIMQAQQPMTKLSTQKQQKPIKRKFEIAVYDVDETNFDTKQDRLFYKEANRYVSAAGTIFSKTTQYYTHNDGDLKKMILPGDIPESSVVTWYNYYSLNA